MSKYSMVCLKCGNGLFRIIQEETKCGDVFETYVCSNCGEEDNYGTREEVKV